MHDATRKRFARTAERVAAHQDERGRERQRARRDERREFTQRVTHDDDGLVEIARRFLRRAERRDGRGEERGLCVRGAVEIGLRPAPTQRSQIEAERVAGFLECARRAHVALRELAAHAHDLRALTGKEPRDTARHGGGMLIGPRP